jgi:tetratricopeptide (TPR) repeat protein
MNNGTLFAEVQSFGFSNLGQSFPPKSNREEERAKQIEYFKMVRRNGHREEGGLVSSRVELYESSPYAYPKSTYRNSDSFTAPSLPVLEQRNGEEGESAYVGSALIENGIQHHAQGEHDKALKCLDVSLNTQRISLGTDQHICIAQTHSCIGSVYLKQGKIVHAKKEFEKVLALNESLSKQAGTSKAHHVLIANTLNNLGNVASLAGDFNTSVHYYAQALQELRQKKGPEADITDVLYNLGRVQLQKNEFDVAISNLTEAHRIAKKIYGENHVHVAQTLNLIGMVQMSMKYHDAATNSFLEAHEIVMDIQGEIHEDVASSWYHIGLVSEQKGSNKDAWESFMKSLSIFSRLGVDQNHRGFKTVRRSIARVEQLISRNKTRL